VAKNALPDRYVVDRRGTPDLENARYYVLDVAHDFEARVALRGLVRKYRYYGPSVRADELETLLNDTDQEFQDFIRARQERLNKPKTRGRPRSARGTA
jgi:hypothetical protein